MTDVSVKLLPCLCVCVCLCVCIVMDALWMSRPFQLFEGNTNDTGVKENRLRYPIIARYVRIYPQRWNRLIALRVEFFGCDYGEQFSLFYSLRASSNHS